MQTIYYFYHDYSETMVERNILEMIDPSLDFFTDIVMHADLSDTRYLYRYGEYISDCELEIARFLNSMEEEKNTVHGRHLYRGLQARFCKSRCRSV